MWKWILYEFHQTAKNVLKLEMIVMKGSILKYVVNLLPFLFNI